MMGGEHSLKISAPQLLRFGIDSVLKIMNERITYLINQSMSDGGDCRIALATLCWLRHLEGLATPGLLIIIIQLHRRRRGGNKPEHCIGSGKYFCEGNFGAEKFLPAVSG